MPVLRGIILLPGPLQTNVQTPDDKTVRADFKLNRAFWATCCTPGDSTSVVTSGSLPLSVFELPQSVIQLAIKDAFYGYVVGVHSCLYGRADNASFAMCIATSSTTLLIMLSYLVLTLFIYLLLTSYTIGTTSQRNCEYVSVKSGRMASFTKFTDCIFHRRN